jgi:hypothetical protein
MGKDGQCARTYGQGPKVTKVAPRDMSKDDIKIKVHVVEAKDQPAADGDSTFGSNLRNLGPVLDDHYKNLPVTVHGKSSTSRGQWAYATVPLIGPGAPKTNAQQFAGVFPVCANNFAQTRLNECDSSIWYFHNTKSTCRFHIATSIRNPPAISYCNINTKSTCRFHIAPVCANNRFFNS